MLWHVEARVGATAVRGDWRRCRPRNQAYGIDCPLSNCLQMYSPTLMATVRWTVKLRPPSRYGEVLKTKGINCSVPGLIVHLFRQRHRRRDRTRQAQQSLPSAVDVLHTPDRAFAAVMNGGTPCACGMGGRLLGTVRSGLGLQACEMFNLSNASAEALASQFSIERHHGPKRYEMHGTLEAMA